MDFTSQLFANQVIPTFYNTSPVTNNTVGRTLSNIPYGGIGSYVVAYCLVPPGTTIDPGTIVDASSLLYFRATAGNTYTGLLYGTNAFAQHALVGSSMTSLGLVGTWRVLNFLINTAPTTVVPIAGLFVRIA